MSHEFIWGRGFQAKKIASAKALHCQIEGVEKRRERWEMRSERKEGSSRAPDYMGF